MEVENAIAAATLAPAAQIVSKKWAMIDENFTRTRLITQASDFDFFCFLLMVTSLVISPTMRSTVKKTTRASATVGLEPTPTPEEEWQLNIWNLSDRARVNCTEFAGAPLSQKLEPPANLARFKAAQSKAP